MAVSRIPRRVNFAIGPRPMLSWMVAGLYRNCWRFSHRN